MSYVGPQQYWSGFFHLMGKWNMDGKSKAGRPITSTGFWKDLLRSEQPSIHESYYKTVLYFRRRQKEKSVKSSTECKMSKLHCCWTCFWTVIHVYCVPFGLHHTEEVVSGTCLSLADECKQMVWLGEVEPNQYKRLCHKRAWHKVRLWWVTVPAHALPLKSF